MNKTYEKRVMHRAKIIEGQFKALVTAIDESKYCVDIITQSLAIQNSLKSLNALVLENHLQQHVGHQLSKQASKAKAVSELVKVYKLSIK